MQNIIQIAINDWVTKELLMAATGLKKGTIDRARKKSWMIGREYRFVSPEGEPKESSECMYYIPEINRWIENLKQPGAL